MSWMFIEQLAFMKQTSWRLVETMCCIYRNENVKYFLFSLSSLCSIPSRNNWFSFDFNELLNKRKAKINTTQVPFYSSINLRTINFSIWTCQASVEDFVRQRVRPTPFDKFERSTHVHHHLKTNSIDEQHSEIHFLPAFLKNSPR